MSKSPNLEFGSPDDVALDPLDAEPGPARPLSTASAAAIADHVVSELQLAPRAQFRSRPARAIVVGGLLSAAAAAAAYAVDRHWSEPARVEPPVVQPPQAPVPPAPLSVAAEQPLATSSPAGGTTHPADRAPEHDLRPIALHSPAAADHLAQANSLRGERRYGEALERYLYVAQAYPKSMQARAAQLAAAAIRLERFGDADGAERLYRRLAAEPGELQAEAEFGLAEVARARGDRALEDRALRNFMERHGEHPLAAAAARRLRALE